MILKGCMDFTSLIYPLKRLFGVQPASLEVTSSQSWEIAPGETAEISPSIHLKKNLKNIIQYHPDSDLIHEKTLIEGGLIHHVPCKAFQFDSVKLIKGYLYKEMLRLKVGNEKPYAINPGQFEHVKEGILSSTGAGSRWFGHWLTDDTSLLLAATELGNPLTIKRNLYAHEEEYLKILNLKSHVLNYAWIDKLIYLQDYGQNSYKRKRYFELRKRVADYRLEKPPLGVYMRRGMMGISAF